MIRVFKVTEITNEALAMQSCIPSPSVPLQDFEAVSGFIWLRILFLHWGFILQVMSNNNNNNNNNNNCFVASLYDILGGPLYKHSGAR